MSTLLLFMSMSPLILSQSSIQKRKWFKERYLLLSPDLDPQESATSKKRKRGIRTLLRELSDEEIHTLVFQRTLTGRGLGILRHT
jgi:hypothetical protein